MTFRVFLAITLRCSDSIFNGSMVKECSCRCIELFHTNVLYGISLTISVIISMISLGSTSGANRKHGRPWWSMINFSKFQEISVILIGFQNISPVSPRVILGGSQASWKIQQYCHSYICLKVFVIFFSEQVIKSMQLDFHMPCKFYY